MDNLEERQSRLLAAKEGVASNSETSSNDGSEIFSQSTAETTSDLDEDNYAGIPEASRIHKYISRKKSSQQVQGSQSTSNQGVTCVTLASYADYIWSHCIDADSVCAQVNHIASEADCNSLGNLEVCFQEKLTTNGSTSAPVDTRMNATGPSMTKNAMDLSSGISPDRLTVKNIALGTGTGFPDFRAQKKGTAFK